jgi:hypothetical protein
VPEDSSDDPRLAYYGRPAGYLASAVSQADQSNSSADTSSKAANSVFADSESTDEAYTADGNQPVYVGTMFRRDQIPDLSPEIRTLIRKVDSTAGNKDWWKTNSKANAGGTKACAYTQVVIRKKGVSIWNRGTDFACEKCTKAGRVCFHAAVISGEMVLVVKNAQP